MFYRIENRKPSLTPAKRLPYRGGRGWNEHSNAVYAAMLRRMDLSVGRILNAIDSAGLDENTLVVFMSDNGVSINAPSPV